MTNENTIPPAVARLLPMLPLQDRLSAIAAAEILGGGRHRLEDVMHMVATGDMKSWTHSRSKGDYTRHRDRYTPETELPRIALDTDPHTVFVVGEDVFFQWCFQFEQAIHAPHQPPLEAVQRRCEYVREMHRTHLLGTAPRQQEPAPTPAPGANTASTDVTPDPERRLAKLRKLGGNATYRSSEWKFTRIAALEASEKAEGRMRSSEKTIRGDLKVAAEAEREARREGFGSGLVRI